MALKDIPFKTLLDQDLYRMLEQTAERAGLSKGQIIREAITNRHKMQLQGIPTCANGRPCYVAHMHLIMSDHATPVTHVTDETAHRLVSPPRPQQLSA